MEQEGGTKHGFHLSIFPSQEQKFIYILLHFQSGTGILTDLDLSSGIWASADQLLSLMDVLISNALSGDLSGKIITWDRTPLSSKNLS